MSVINLKDRVITLKVVYYGPATGGKTTSLQFLHRVLDPERRVKLVSLATSGDQTLFFDFLPIDLGSVNGFSTKVQGFTVPGQIRYAKTRRFVLAGADAVVFVANSDPACRGENAESLADFLQNLRANGLDPETIPLAIQYNKRDLPGATPIAEMQQEIRFRPVPEFPTVATEGEGVFDAFEAVIQEAIEKIAGQAGTCGSEARKAVRARLGRSRIVPVVAEAPERTTVQAIRATPMAPERDESELLEKALASSVELSRLYAEVSVTRNRLDGAVTHATALNRLARRMLQAPASDRVRTEFFEACRKEAGCSRATLLGHDRRRAPLEELAIEGLDADPLIRVLGKQTLPFLKHLGDATPIDAETSPELIQGLRRIDPAIEGLMLVPVSMHGEIDCGTVLYRTSGEPTFRGDTTRHLSSIAAMTSLALTRAARDEEILRLNHDLEARVRERTSRLSAALDTIRELNSALQSRVQARTCELEKANEALKQTEEFLIRAERMSSLACLASGIAHEVNNPMAYIQGNLRTLRSYAGDLASHFTKVEESLGRDTPEDTLHGVREAMSDPGILLVREDLPSLISESEEGADRVVRVVKGMRNLAHLRVDEATTVDLRLCIEDALSVLQDQLAGRVELTLDLGDPPEIRGFPTLLSQVFLNLIVNAVQAMDGKGTLKIRSTALNGFAAVDIADSGPGIPEAIQGRLFEPFFTTKAVGEGTGLGLYTVYQIVERHGGRISARNIPGAGAVFRVELPTNRSETSDEAEE